MTSDSASHRSDGSLAREASRGDLHAFDLLVRRYRNLVLTHLLRFALLPEEAEDLAQEAFLAAFLRLRQLREPERFLPWLLSIARNLAIARARSKHATHSLPGDVPRDEQARQEAALIVARALDGLPHRRRKALEMFAVEGREQREIAQAFARPAGTIRRWISEAREQLRREQQEMSEIETQPPRGYLASNVMEEADVTRVFAALQEAGLHPGHFRDYESFERALREKPPAIIVLDELVGDCGAFELMPLLKGRPETRHLPVVMLGPGRERTVFAAWHAGVDCYLSKPFQQRELAVFVARIVGEAADPLTGTLNPRAFEQALHREREQAQHEGYALALAALDVDRFQRVNEEFGREQGNRVVKAVAEALTDSVGEAGTVGRSAGDEFAVLMPRSNRAQAGALLAQAQQRLNERTDLPVRIHLACGAFSWEGQAIPEPQEMLRIAREEMLRDKLRPGGARADM